MTSRLWSCPSGFKIRFKTACGGACIGGIPAEAPVPVGTHLHHIYYTLPGTSIILRRVRTVALSLIITIRIIRTTIRKEYLLQQ
jgi:hypothetical protein